MQRLTIAIALLVCGCAHPDKGRETDTLQKQIAKAQVSNRAATADAKEIKLASGRIGSAATRADTDLSRTEGKAAVIKEWFRQHRK